VAIITVINKARVIVFAEIFMGFSSDRVNLPQDPRRETNSRQKPTEDMASLGLNLARDTSETIER
jgi:hypothetical protein